MDDDNKQIAEYDAQMLDALCMRVVDALTFQRMAALVRVAGQAIDYFEELYRPRIQDAQKVVDNLRSDMRKLQEPAVEAKKWGNAEIKAYNDAQEAIAAAKKAELEKNQDPYAPPVIVETDVPKGVGILFRDNWKFEIIEPGLIPRDYLIPDEVAIGKIVRALKGTCKIPGVRVYRERIPVKGRE